MTNDIKKMREELTAARRKATDTAYELAAANSANEKLRKRVYDLDDEVCRKDNENMKLEQELAQKDYEILKLKAMLFDIMLKDKTAG
jgi:chromosome segregation ATPase